MDDRDDERRHVGGVEAPGLSPVRAFLVVCVLATAVGGALFATRDASPSERPGPATPRTPDYTLTDAEAIAEFERLHNLQVRAYEERDLSLVTGTYTSTSPLLESVQREITRLLRTNVTTSTHFVTERLSVLSNSADELVFHQTVVIDASFFDARGKEVSLAAPAELQRIRWTLRFEGHEWRIHDAEIVASRPVRGGAR